MQGPRGDERRSRLRGRRGRAPVDGRPRRHRRAPGAVRATRRPSAPAPGAAAPSRTPATPAAPPTCSASRSTCWDLADRLPRRRGRRLRRRVRRRPHPQPVPALQREDQVRRAARQGPRARLRRRRAPATTRRRSRADGRELHRAVDARQGPVATCSACSTPEQLGHAMFPLGDTAPRPRSAPRPPRAASRWPTSPTRHDICFIPDGDTQGFLARPARRGRATSSTRRRRGRSAPHEGAYGVHHRPAQGPAASARPRADGKPRYVLDDLAGRPTP